MDIEHDINCNINYCDYLELDDIRKKHPNNNNSCLHSLLQVNIVSLNANIAKLRTLRYGMNSYPDFIGVSETRINNDNIDTNILTGYDFVYDNAPSNGRAGGAGMFITDGIQYKVRVDLKIRSNDCENIWIETSHLGKKKIVAVIYRHPRHNFSNFQNELILKLKKLEDDNYLQYICGDININLIKTASNNAIKFYFD